MQEEGVLPLGCRPSPVPGPTVYPGQQLIALTQLATALPSPRRCLDLSGERALPGVLHLNPEEQLFLISTLSVIYSSGFSFLLTSQPHVTPVLCCS